MEETKNVLKNYKWPGNVRELSNTIQKILIFNRGTPISPEDVSLAISDKREKTESKGNQEIPVIRQWIRETLKSQEHKNMFDSCMDRFASLLIGEALQLTGGNRSRAAKLLGISRPTLHSKIDKYGLEMETSVKES